MDETNFTPVGSEPTTASTRLTVISGETADENADDKRAQRAATSRANARRSTGPISTEGKRRSRKNAMKHGLTSRTLLAEASDDPAFIEITERLRDEYRPQTLAEEIAVESAAMQWSRLSFAHGYERGRDATHRRFGSDMLERFLRYNGAAERSLFRALERLQAAADARASAKSDDVDGELMLGD